MNLFATGLGIAVGLPIVLLAQARPPTPARVGRKPAKITATIPAGVAESEGGLGVSADSVWLLTDAKSTLARLDPATNKIVAEVRLPAGCFTEAFGEGALWVTCTNEN